ncbi:MAG: hypothetical protein KC442_20505 [Thermomicrobiales bacterium]|nr:hypothetical protein [Thermomicrobiales bacterium]
MDELVAAIGECPAAPVLIAIGGFGGSGKSTLAERIHRQLPNSLIIHMDDFIVKALLSQPAWDTGMFDRARLEQQVLRPARSGQAIIHQPLDWDSGSLGEPVQVPRADYVIVEGVSSYHEDIAHYYDVKIWVDVPMDTALRRGHARPGSHENAGYWETWTQNDLAYFERHQPRQAADYVFDNRADERR